MNEKAKKRYVVKKFIMAENALQAMKLDKASAVDSVWVDEEWDKENIKIGFNAKAKGK